MMINYQEAKKIAVSFFGQIEQEMEISLLIVESHVRENDDEWFFPYSVKRIFRNNGYKQIYYWKLAYICF